MFRSLAITLAVVTAACQSAMPETLTVSDPCPVGTYRLADGSDVDIGTSGEANLRWYRKDGTSGKLINAEGRWISILGWTEKPDGKTVTFSPCPDNKIIFAGMTGNRIAFDTTDVTFQGSGASLAGRLVMPEGDGPVPIVVLVHGSEHTSARDAYALQRLFPSVGIGAFVYDKRGTGASGGTYTQDYLTLAVDAVAAAREARRLAGSRAARVGYQAGSQGGWVAPLAATIEPVAFLVIGFGLAVSPLDEDREAIALDMTRHGHGPEDMVKAMEVADAVAAIVISDFRDGYAELDALKAKYAGEDWLADLHGNIAFFLLQTPEAQIREMGPQLLAHVPAQYDPMPVLENLDVPQLWILGEEDLDAPYAKTLQRLTSLASKGKPISTALFPGAEHGIYEFETQPDGTRLSIRQPDGYFAMMRDFILTGELKDSYGTARLSVAKEQDDTGAFPQ